MRVLHVHSGNLYGGIETLLSTLWRERAQCPEVWPEFALCFEGRLSDELRVGGAPMHALGSVRARSPLAVRRARRALAAVLRQNSYDVVSCHSPWSQALFGPVVRRAGVPLVFWMHAPPTGGHWLERWARLHAPDLVVCNSRFTADSAGKLYPRVPAEVVYCPVPGAEASPPPTAVGRSETRAEVGTPEGATVVVQVSRMEALKGHALHLEALGLLRDVPGWVCWLVGGAQRPQEVKYVEGLKRLATRLGIAERVRFVGERADVVRFLAAADIYSQPNVGPEAFGPTFVEAMRAGLPVVTTAIGGAREIVDDSCGVLVPPGDAHALASSLHTLIDGPGFLRARLGEGGRRRARQFCDPAAQLQRLHRVLSVFAGREAAA